MRSEGGIKKEMLGEEYPSQLTGEIVERIKEIGVPQVGLVTDADGRFSEIEWVSGMDSSGPRFKRRVRIDNERNIPVEAMTLDVAGGKESIISREFGEVIEDVYGLEENRMKRIIEAALIEAKARKGDIDPLSH